MPVGLDSDSSAECVYASPDGPPSPDARGFIHSVETCGTVDGPGLRYVLFLHGCPLRCQYCHNPDAQGKPAGESLTAEAAFADVLRYKSFMKRGGLTISGGEPLMQPAFVHAMFAMARAEGIHTALDTSGFVGHRAGDALLDLTDLVLLDLKSHCPVTHKALTGVPVDPVLEFSRRLDSRGNRVWVRFVLVPGLTDGRENVEGLARFTGALGNVDRVEILPFHKMGEEKYRRSGIRYDLHDTPAPTDSEIERVRRVFEDYGVAVV